jgi:hypothetical protein
MRSLEDRLDITFHNRERLSYREVARRLGGNRRTVRKHAEHPADYGDRPGSASCGTGRRAQRSYAHRGQSRVRKAPCSAQRPAHRAAVRGQSSGQQLRSRETAHGGTAGFLTAWGEPKGPGVPHTG